MNILNVFVFLGIIILALMFDFYKHRNSEDISLKESVLWVLFYMGLSAVFSVFIYFRMGFDASILFVTGWGLEKVLAVDNLVVFSAIFSYFRIEDKYQHRILYFGVIGAIVLRLLFVTIGTSAAHEFGNSADIVFGMIILYTAWLMFKSGDDEKVDYSNLWYIKLVKKWIPVTEERKDGEFFINGKATVFLFALIAIELSDIMFAFDSVPAIISITKEPFLVYSSMMFAVLGLRSMYFVLSALTRNLEYFELAIILVLIFVSVKLLIKPVLGIEIDPFNSLFIILSILTAGVILSKIKVFSYEV